MVAVLLYSCSIALAQVSMAPPKKNIRILFLSFFFRPSPPPPFFFNDGIARFRLAGGLAPLKSDLFVSPLRGVMMVRIAERRPNREYTLFPPFFFFFFNNNKNFEISVLLSL